MSHVSHRVRNPFGPSEIDTRVARETRLRVVLPEAGLCPTCRHAESCTFPRAEGRPILQCEEFEGLTSVAARPTATVPALKIDGDPALKGLCRFCEHRAACTYPKPEAGVWHCEEYE